MLALVLAAQLAAPLNAVQIENARRGSPDWEISNPALGGEIEGYASATSVDAGDPIDLFVNTPDPRFSVDVFRMGWYGGAGARRVAGPFDRQGVHQDIPQADPSSGLLECRWRDPVHLDTRDGSEPWTSGVYLARLTAQPSTKQSFIVFVVRDDRRAAAIVLQSSVTTFAAYNNWGGKSLYAFNSGGAQARKVSFDRPYAANPYGVGLDGAGEFLRRWEYNAVRFFEREGYDVKYVTDVDTHLARLKPGTTDPGVFVVAGHDAYWSVPMREHVEAMRDRGVHLAFLGAGISYWRIRFEPNGTGVPNRTIVSYKEAAGDDDPLALDGNPENDRLITGRWRDRPAARPEERLIGVMYAADPVDGDIVIDEAAHWAFDGTGATRGMALPGLLGSIVDGMKVGGLIEDEPRNRERLAHSPFVDQGSTRYADMTMYTAPSGAIVFAAGSINWIWGLDSYNAPRWHPDRTNAIAQQTTRNVLTRMLRTVPTAAPAETRRWMPSWIVLAAAVAGIAVVVRAWLARPRT